MFVNLTLHFQISWTSKLDASKCWLLTLQTRPTKYKVKSTELQWKIELSMSDFSANGSPGSPSRLTPRHCNQILDSKWYYPEVLHPWSISPGCDAGVLWPPARWGWCWGRSSAWRGPRPPPGPASEPTCGTRARACPRCREQPAASCHEDTSRVWVMESEG